MYYFTARVDLHARLVCSLYTYIAPLCPEHGLDYVIRGASQDSTGRILCCLFDDSSFSVSTVASGITACDYATTTTTTYVS